MGKTASWRKRINIDSGILGGKPVIAGTRVPVQIIVGSLAGGMTGDEVCEQYKITSEDVTAALAYAAEVLTEETVHALPSR
jgi:uncharacterized protein (DUF433 family)